MARIVFIFIFSVYFVSSNGYLHLDWESQNPAFDQSFYDSVLDPELCDQQLSYIQQDFSLTMQFVESGMRIPRSILMGNTLDWGNYFQCLGINEAVETTNIKGKYCSISVPLNQSINLPTIPELPTLPEGWPEWIPEWLPGLIPWAEQKPRWIDFDPRNLRVDGKTMKELKRSQYVSKAVRSVNGDDLGSQLSGVSFTLAVCIPKPCAIKDGINGLLLNLTEAGFSYTENFCRLADDKPWVPADYVAITIFVLLGLITLLSTSYDIWHSIVMKSVTLTRTLNTLYPKSTSTLLKSFSVYTNARRLTTFTTTSGALECVDGIRALSMMWVILGHTFFTLPSRVNLIDSALWTFSFDSIWVTAAPIAVDTFFMLSGMLLVYTVAGKMTGPKLLKNLHLFYINRIIRMFPLLAAGILLQISIFHRISDGPNWGAVATQTENCRNYWWSTLLYVQNFFNPDRMCLPHSWYLAIDMQLYILSPLVLFWVLGKNKKIAWSALITALTAVLIISSVYIFIKEFPGSGIAPAYTEESMANYMTYYYLNSWTRASPFFVGMLFGYLLHLWRGKTVVLGKVAAVLIWGCTGIILLSVLYSHHPMKSLDWDNQTVDSIVNSFHRPLWAFGLGLLIFGCHHGYGGPINWLLSLQLWKLPSRLSYGMYIFHYPIMYVATGSVLQPIFFTTMNTMFKFFAYFSIALLVSFVLTLLIDSPFSSLFKLLLGGHNKSAQKPEEIKNGGQNGLNSIEVRNKYTAKL